MKILRRMAAGWVALWLTLTLGAGGELEPVADPAPNRGPYRIEYLGPYEAREAELIRILEQHRACEETGQWHEWPCSQWDPPSHHPR